MSAAWGHAAPIATYRLQFTPSFRFRDALRILPYLRRLGVSHVYASPITRARPGSTHGYDVCDPREANPELGTRDELLELLHAVRAAGMGWVQDTVPNHLAASVGNPLWRDVLKHGRRSRWAGIFDIDWEHPGIRGRVQIPILGESYEDVLASGKFTVVSGNEGPEIAYGDLRLPLDPETAGLLPRALEGSGAGAPAIDPRALDRLLQAQPWKAVHWREAREVIGYRRFFAVDDLVAINIERNDAFTVMHGLVFDLADQGLIDALRIDHIDGLREPDAYLARLRERLPRVAILVEKILVGEERLPSRWPVAGTTGYDFLAAVGPACADPASRERLDRLHRRIAGFTGDPRQFSAELREGVGALGLAGDLDRVVRCILAAAPDDAAQIPPADARAAVSALVARLPVYRTYGLAEDAALLADAAQRAASERPALAHGVFQVHRVLAAGLDPAAVPAAREAALRFQQFSGPVMAKGCEDTFFYAFTRWLADNEVGGDPLAPVRTPDGFVRSAAARGAAWPTTLNATATHDTKRGEDTRARLMAFTWFPEAWSEAVDRWIGSASGEPHGDDQYLALQTIAGTWPGAAGLDRTYRERIQACVLKSLREAGRRTRWSDQDEAYERVVAGWIDRRLQDGSGDRHAALDRLVQAAFACEDAIALAQTLLKCTLPGVPDVYQGCEWPDHSLVDPDNRRPVDFAARSAALVPHQGTLPPVGDPRRKQGVLHRCLLARRAAPALWLEGSVEPLAVGGDATGVFAFRRVHGDASAVVVARVGRGGPASLALPDGTWLDALSGTEHPGGTTPVAQLLRTAPCALLLPKA